MTKRKRRKKDELAGRGKILDAWVPPADAGGPIGCLATTFTIDNAFYEEHCLGRFLSIETVPGESGAEYLIERETKMREAYCAAVVDRSQAGEERSLSWDVLSVHVPSGCMHAKVSLLAWANHIRVIVASANLTEPGYRSNLELYAMFDFADGTGDARDLLVDAVAFLRGLVGRARDNDAVKSRGIAFLDGVLERASGWKEPKRNPEHPEARFIANGDVGGGARSVLATLREEIWKKHGPPRFAAVFSPFFDKEPKSTVEALRTVLAQRGETSLELCVATRRSADGKVIVQAPASLASELRGDDDCMQAVVLETESEVRPLHAKGLWLGSERRIMWMLGSSNFTSAGFGIGTTGNIEANVAFSATNGTDSEQAVRLGVPETDEEGIDVDAALFEPAFEGAACGLLDGPAATPVSFGAATFIRDENGARVELVVDISSLPERWWIRASDEDTMLASWESNSISVTGILTVAWLRGRLPSALDIRWIGRDGTEQQGQLTVNVATPESLPVLAELRELSLETLLEILTMAKPLHEAVARCLARRQAMEGRAMAPELDPHKRVNTEQFLIQRTKRFARALEGLKKRLEEPAFSLDAWRHRLNGPLGPMAVAKAVEREAVSDGERCFLIAEMILLLKHIKPRDARGAIGTEVRLAAIEPLRSELRATLAPHLDGLGGDLRRYVDRASQEAA